MKFASRAVAILLIYAALLGACQSTLPAPIPARTATPRPILKVTATALLLAPALPISPSEMPATTAQSSCSPFPQIYRGCILSFTAVPTEVVAGGSLTFTWAVTDSTIVGLEQFGFYDSTFDHGRRSWANLPAIGSLTIQLTDTQRGAYRFILWADTASGGARATNEVYFDCTDTFFFVPVQPYFGPPCPAGPAVPIQVTQQSFEHGLMIWMNSEDSVYILYNRDYFPLGAPTVGKYDIAGEVMALESGLDGTPPPGKYRPVHTLGGVWQKYNLSQTLGWALAPELTFTSLIQYNYPGWPFYLRTAEGRILAVKYTWGPHYDDPSWSYLSP
jgi:hypothetical protein